VTEQALANPAPSLIADKQLPLGYTEASYWRLATDWRRLAIANLLGLVIAPIATVAFGLFAVAAAGLSPLDYFGVGSHDYPGALIMLVFLVALTFTMVVHELTHGMTIKLVGNRPSYGFQWVGLVPYATAEGQYFTRDEFIAAALAPLVCLSIIGCLLLPIAPAWLAPWVLFALIANAAGAAGDIWMSVIALRYPRSTWIMDERDGMRIFVAS
jgi:hypothetical protein